MHLNFSDSVGGTGWGEPDPLAEEHDALLRNILADHGITQADVDAGNGVDVLSCSCLIYLANFLTHISLIFTSINIFH